MSFDISALVPDTQQPVTIRYNEDITVDIRFISREKLNEFLQAATKKEWDRKHQPVETFDAIKYSELLGLEVIAGWSGMVNGTEPFPCTPDNIKLLMRKWTDFAKFVSDVSGDLDRLEEARQEAERKNSLTTSGPEQITPE